MPVLAEVDSETAFAFLLSMGIDEDAIKRRIQEYQQGVQRVQPGTVAVEEGAKNVLIMFPSLNTND